MKNTLIGVETRDDGVSIITLKRSDKRNALNIAMMDELCSAFNSLHQSGCHVVILSAEGEVFCSGADLKEIGNPDLMETSIASLARMLTTLFTTQMVTIAAVQGDALGGGGGLAALCDIVLVAKEANFAFPETRRGLVAAQIATILTRQISLRHIRELLLTGEPITAERACAIGLANHVVKKEELMKEALNCAHNVLLGTPEAIKMTKMLISDLTPREFSADLQHGLSLYRAIRETKEASDRIDSFLKKM